MSVERRHFTLDDRAVSVYQYVPFEVPRGASAFTVTMAYDRSLATVDLGLDGPDRFRGWSGGERSEVTVAPTWATPGYQPGELAGEWRVVLGLYRVGGAGVDVEVGVEVHVDPVAPPRLRSPHPARSARNDEACQLRQGVSGWPATSTATPCTPMARSRSSTWPTWRHRAGSTCWRSPTTTR